MTKAAIRAQVRLARRKQSARSLAHAGAAIAERVMELPEIRDAVTAHRAVATYLAMPLEPPTQPLVDALHAAGVTILVPRVAGDELEWVALSAADETRVSARGIDEPTSVAAGPGDQPLLDCAVVVMPALAVDRAGRRLGQGGGFYDRALARVPRSSTPPTLVALIFDQEVLDTIPAEPHDISVDVAVTPTTVLRFGQATLVLSADDRETQSPHAPEGSHTGNGEDHD